MLKQEIIEFGKLLVSSVRDVTIRSCDVQLHTDNLDSPIARRWRDAKSNGQTNVLGEMIIADSIDDTIFFLLQAIDQGILDLSIKSSTGEYINLSEEGHGELSGWYIGDWRSEFSQERNFED
jgi:hypothetical protein